MIKARRLQRVNILLTSISPSFSTCVSCVYRMSQAIFKYSQTMVQILQTHFSVSVLEGVWRRSCTPSQVGQWCAAGCAWVLHRVCLFQTILASVSAKAWLLLRKPQLPVASPSLPKQRRFLMQEASYEENYGYQPEAPNLNRKLSFSCHDWPTTKPPGCASVNNWDVWLAPP